jgi:hypothetical protein
MKGTRRTSGWPLTATPWRDRRGQSQPAPREMRMASMRLRPPTLAMAFGQVVAHGRRGQRQELGDLLGRDAGFRCAQHLRLSGGERAASCLQGGGHKVWVEDPFSCCHPADGGSLTTGRLPDRAGVTEQRRQARTSRPHRHPDHTLEACSLSRSSTTAPTPPLPPAPAPACRACASVPIQRPDRSASVHRGGHRQAPRLQHPPQARPPQPCPGRDPRLTCTAGSGVASTTTLTISSRRKESVPARAARSR